MNLTIGQIAAKVGVSTETLRRWEAEGLIPLAKRRFIARWRVWTGEDIEVIERIVRKRYRQRNERKPKKTTTTKTT